MMKTFLLTILFLTSFPMTAQIVRMETNLGNIDIQMHPDVAPNTVANFLKYMNNGDYDNSFFHRSVNDFVIQNGGFKFTERQIVGIIPYATVDNEFSLSNVRGTLAMAKINNQPDSAQNQWFINVEDNNTGDASLDAQNGGFTVFATVIDGMGVVDSINSINKANLAVNIGFQTFNFSDVPYIGALPTFVSESNAVIINKVRLLNPSLNMNIGLSGAWYNTDTSGQGIFIDYLPQSGENINDLAFTGWFTYDTEQPNDEITSTIGDAGHRWMTGIGEVNTETNSITFNLSLSTGGLFDNQIDVTTTSIDGSMTITFSDCESATVSYQLTAQNLSGSFPVIRVTNDTELCRNLSEQAARQNSL